MFARTKRFSWFNSLKTTTLLALPILFAHLIEGLFPFINTLLAARLGPEALAAAGLVGAAFITFMGFGWGLITSIGILSAHLIGSNEPLASGRVLKSGLMLSVLYGLPVMVLFYYIKPILLMLGQDPSVVEYTHLYLRGLMWGVIADVAKFGIFQYLAAFDKPRFAVITHLVALPLLIALNSALVWGWGPFPQLGIYGIGLGTSIIYWGSFALMFSFVLCREPFKSAFMAKAKIGEYWQTLKEQLKLGAPIGGMFLIEIAFFATVALLMGRISTQALAAHQVAVQMLGVTMLIAFGFAEAVTILVGKASGSDNFGLAKETSLVGIVISVLLMALVGFVYWFKPLLVIGFDLDLTDPINEEVIGFAVGFLSMCALFQVFDAARIVASGALRGMKDSQFPMWVAFISFWMIGLPMGYWLAFTFDWGGMGLWVGMLLAVIVSLILQGYRLAKKF